MSLYLKYRPRSFADVVGQDHIVTTLEHAVERDQLVHAYLFFGPRGTGKTSMARILAKILLIRDVQDETLQKQILQSVDDGNLVDLIEIDAATNRQIDDVRDLKEKVQFAPSIASAKVYIIDEVHMMTKEAFNALLKTLEEPPDHVYFILATTELHKVPETIQSRCQRFPFHQIGDEDILRSLQNIADKERIKVTRGALRAIARHVNGGMRDAISLLDQLSSLAEVTEEEVRRRIGESAEEGVENLWEALENRDRMTVLTIISSLQEKGVSLEVFLRQLLSRARQDLHACIEAKTDTKPSLERIDAIFGALRDIRISPVPAIALEVALVELCMKDEGEVDTEKKEKKKKGEGKGEHVSESKKEETAPVKEVPTVASSGATFVAREMTLEAVREVWNGIVTSVQPASVRMSLKDAQLQKMEGDHVTLAFSSSFHKEKITDPKASRDIERALKDAFHQTVHIVCVLQEEQALAGAAAHAEETVNMAEAVAEIFGR
jgi:DNA polymerase-3 subunit gamma/tau